MDRRFWVADGRRAEFESVFGSHGPWTGLLHEAVGYPFTEVWCEIPEVRQYRVKDSWTWHRNFERFRGRFQEKFEKFEEWLRSSMLIEKEQFLGAYYEKSDRGDEDDKVLS